MSEEFLPRSSKLAFGGITLISGLFSNLVIATSFTYFYNVKLGLDASWTALAWLLFILALDVNKILLETAQESIRNKGGDTNNDD